MADTAKAPLGAGHEVSIVRVFKAPPALVFDCFTKPEHLAKWWGPLGCVNTELKIDPRPGGDLSLRMAGQGFDHVMGGEYVEIDPPRRLVFRTKAFQAPDGGWGIVNYNTITFQEEPDGTTRMVLHTLVEKAAGELVLGALAGMKAGWGQSLERLGELVGGGGKTDIEVEPHAITLTRAFDVPPGALWRALSDPVRWSRPAPAVLEALEAHPPVRETYGLEEQWGRTVLVRTLTFRDDRGRDALLEAGLDRSTAEGYDALAGLLAT